MTEHIYLSYVRDTEYGPEEGRIILSRNGQPTRDGEALLAFLRKHPVTEHTEPPEDRERRERHDHEGLVTLLIPASDRQVRQLRSMSDEEYLTIITEAARRRHEGS